MWCDAAAVAATCLVPVETTLIVVAVTKSEKRRGLETSGAGPAWAVDFFVASGASYPECGEMASADFIAERSRRTFVPTIFNTAEEDGVASFANE